MGMGSIPSSRHKLLCIAVINEKSQCKVLCDVKTVLNPFLFLDRSYIKLQLLRACKSADLQEKVSKANKENWMKVQSIIVGEKINAFSFAFIYT